MSGMNVGRLRKHARLNNVKGEIRKYRGKDGQTRSMRTGTQGRKLKAAKGVGFGKPGATRSNDDQIVSEVLSDLLRELNRLLRLEDIVSSVAQADAEMVRELRAGLFAAADYLKVAGTEAQRPFASCKA